MLWDCVAIVVLALVFLHAGFMLMQNLIDNHHGFLIFAGGSSQLVEICKSDLQKLRVTFLSSATHTFGRFCFLEVGSLMGNPHIDPQTVQSFFQGPPKRYF